jgi:hypothetical protein
MNISTVSKMSDFEGPGDYSIIVCFEDGTW